VAIRMALAIHTAAVLERPAAGAMAAVAVALLELALKVEPVADLPVA
jgi:hypothetical protein